MTTKPSRRWVKTQHKVKTLKCRLYLNKLCVYAAGWLQETQDLHAKHPPDEQHGWKFKYQQTAAEYHFIAHVSLVSRANGAGIQPLRRANEDARLIKPPEPSATSWAQTSPCLHAKRAQSALTFLTPRAQRESRLPPLLPLSGTRTCPHCVSGVETKPRHCVGLMLLCHWTQRAGDVTKVCENITHALTENTENVR